MRAASPVISLSFAGCLLASAPVHGIGFGRVVNGTQLGQPLDFATVVKLDADEVLARECVFAEVLAGDNRISPGLVRVSLASVSGAAGDAERVVRVTTSTPIDEPVVTVNVTLGCTSRVTRQFVAFVDPPGFALAPSAGAPLALPPASAPTLAVDTLSREIRPGAVVPVPRRDVDPRVASGRVSAAASEPARRRAAPPRIASPAGPRLQLDAPQVAAVAAPAVAASVTAPPPATTASASAAGEQAEALARERRRIQSLENDLAELRAESRAQKQALTALQVQVGGTRSQRYANPLVYTLAALCLLLTTAVCALLGRRSRDRAAARWLTSTLLARSAEPARPGAAAPVIAAPIAASAEAAPAARVAPPVAPTPAPGGSRKNAPAGARGQSVEELIDLEQQADFFVVLGQDDAAIDLLNGHVGGSDSTSSPMPLLKLLELHQRVGDRAGYDRVRDRIDRNFNARTPGFDGDPAAGRTLDGHPDILARLQALWSTPAQALDALEALVFRQRASDESFDLPAFRELVFLRAIATDHVGRPGGETGLRSAVEAARRAGQAGARLPSPSPVPSTLDLDLSAAPVRPAVSRVPVPGQRLPVLTAAALPFDGTETMPSAQRRAPGYANESAFVDLELEFPGLDVQRPH